MSGTDFEGWLGAWGMGTYGVWEPSGSRHGPLPFIIWGTASPPLRGLPCFGGQRSWPRARLRRALVRFLYRGSRNIFYDPYTQIFSLFLFRFIIMKIIINIFHPPFSTWISSGYFSGYIGGDSHINQNK